MTTDFSDDEFLDDVEYLHDEDDHEVGAAPAWIMSVAVHAVLLLIMSVIVFGTMPEIDPPPLAVSIIDPVEIDDVEEKKERDIDPVEVEIKDLVTDEPVVVDLEVPVEELETEDPVEDEAVEPKGREDAVAVSEAGGALAFMAIGPGGAASGAFGNRSGGGKKKALRDGGGGPRSEIVVHAALEWFKRHQSENGQWDVDGYMDNCQDDLKCEPGTAHTTANGGGDTACTAYATLCYLGAGFDHRTPGKFRNTVQRALDWLKAQQNADGSFGVQKRNYENGVCAMALCEAYAMTIDPTLKEPAQLAVDYLVSRQAKSDSFPYGAGWDYSAAKPSRNDGSVTGWCIMALKAAKSAGLDVGDSWEGSKAYVDAAWKAANPGHENLDAYGKSVFPYTFDQITGEAKSNRLASVGALCSIFLGKRPGDVMLDTLSNTIMEKQLPAAYPCNTYFMYYNTLAMFQYGGEKWETWNNQVKDMLIDAQHKNGSGCFNGSWDYEGTKFHGHETGRLLSTAYCCLSLEVYYRYARVKNK